MIEVGCYKGETVGVFGLARSGLSAIRALRAGGARIFAWDDKEAPRLVAAHEGAAVEPWESWPWEELKAVILSPGVPLTHPEPHAIVQRAREVGAEVIGDIELFARTIRLNRNTKGAAPVIGVTGTNGKSTTTALIGHILQACGYDAQVGGNIGKPVLDLGAPSLKTVYVLEISSYQIDLSPRLICDVALLTNLSPDHIDRHGSMAHYAAVKEKLLAQTAPDGYVAVGVDDPDSSAIYTKLAVERGNKAVAVSVGKALGRGIFVIDGKLYDAWDQPAVAVGDLKAAARLPGTHNWQNAALAYAAVKRIVRDTRGIMAAMMRFPGLAHRIEDVGHIGKVRFINDSKATNADAAARALACYSDIFWIAGGKPKEGGIAELAPYFPSLRRAYVIGEAAESFGRTLQGKVDAVQSGTLDRALQAAFEDAQRSDAAEPVVLLSPACASFDQFRDFEQRGDVFRKMVKAMIDSQTVPSRKETAS
ncbi:MAG TPA: UDP-N-acetylmuramoyl-L-alanine--D-glutamate ligase [Micropepsaceae bacterium]|nr:UDP-N-acetylmuramoyl-L-alanine--D-glutamate ligase [Micropepsaceae bacterium]